jgi:hypothetical protein
MNMNEPITLPDGKTVTLAKLINHYAALKSFVEVVAKGSGGLAVPIPGYYESYTRHSKRVTGEARELLKRLEAEV